VPDEDDVPFEAVDEVGDGAEVVGARDAAAGRAGLEAGQGHGVGVEVVDRRPDRVRLVIYVDSGPLVEGAAIAASATEAVEVPLPTWEAFAAQGSSTEGIDDAGLVEFRRRAVPHPAEVVRGGVHVTDPRRFDVPATVNCTSIPAEQIKTMANGGPPFHTELGDLHDVTWVDLPTGHWPMFSRPTDLAAAISEAARA
jgi:pimeloyl-ACP methyl ester carboxylesterase